MIEIGPNLLNAIGSACALGALATILYFFYRLARLAERGE